MPKPALDDALGVLVSSSEARLAQWAGVALGNELKTCQGEI